MEGGGWRVEGLGWRVWGGGWRVEGGGWRVYLCNTSRSLSPRCFHLKGSDSCITQLKAQGPSRTFNESKKEEEEEEKRKER